MTKNCIVVMPEKEIKEHKEFVIYNYLATIGKKITEEAIIAGLKAKYHFNLSKNEANAIIDEYVRSGLLTSTYEKSIGLCYNWVG